MGASRKLTGYESSKALGSEPGENDDELSDYRILLSCMRKRLENYGMYDALDRLERLDDAIVEAICSREPLPKPPTIN